MAFTAVHYPMDKDQGQFVYWPDNDELEAVATENFFDQFVTFDAGDSAASVAAAAGLSADDMFEEDPPSPSILLDSLKEDSLINSSLNDQDRNSSSSQQQSAVIDVADSETATTAAAPFTISPPLDIVDQVEYNNRQNGSAPSPDLLSVLTGDPILGGSISDSELLRLEGISLRSPRGTATAPSSPPLLASVTTTTNPPPSLSPRKHSRFMDNVCATVRRVTGRSRPAVAPGHNGHSSPHNNSTMDALKRGVRPATKHYQQQQHHYQQYQLPGADMSHHKHHGHAHHNGLDIIIKPEPVDNDGLPLSPPLTGTIPMPGQHNGMRFVNGHIDDPFSDSLMGVHAQTTMIPGQDTHLNTPGLDADAFYQHALATVEQATAGNNATFSQVKPDPHQESADWSMDGLLASVSGDNTQLWPSSSSPSDAVAYIPDSHNNNSGELLSPGWWEAANCKTPHHHGNNLSTVHNSSYEYSNGTDGLSGLMIHMPQPRPPQAAVLSSAASELNNNINADDDRGLASSSVTASDSRFPMPTSSSSSYHHGHHIPHQHYHTPHHHGHTERRPRPRAPSSGARHHGSMTSPRKLQHSSSRPYMLRESSTSPTPTHQRYQHSQHHQQRTSSISVRKRRSFNGNSNGSSSSSSSRRTTSGDAPPPPPPPRTPRSATSSGSFGCDAETTTTTPTPRNRSTAGAATTIGFVNFTPSDKNVLMTGVAPSGSSKTKARREKELADRQRKLSEATIRAVKEAGGDVEKFIEQGGFWGGAWVNGGGPPMPGGHGHGHGHGVGVGVGVGMGHSGRMGSGGHHAHLGGSGGGVEMR